MSNHINIYNNLIKLTRNKSLYENIGFKENFSIRLVLFLIHFAFFIKIYKKVDNRNYMQEIYDFIFHQIEISIREIGYGDVSINKKMKDYLNTFHKIIELVDNWKDTNNDKKSSFFLEYLNESANTTFFINYFDDFEILLKNNSLNSFNKDILKL